MINIFHGYIYCPYLVNTNYHLNVQCLFWHVTVQRCISHSDNVAVCIFTTLQQHNIVKRCINVRDVFAGICSDGATLVG